jgi:hypothetical protein
MIINMIKPLRPGIYAPFLYINQFTTKTTPETALAIPTNATLVEFYLNRVTVGNAMLSNQVFLETLSAVTDLRTSSSF